VKTAFVVSNERMASCFAGNEIRVYADLSDASETEVVSSAGWEPRDWVDELRRRDVELLVCVSVNRFLWGALRGSGISVTTDVVGALDNVVERWRRGEIEVDSGYGPGCGSGVGQRRGRGRGRHLRRGCRGCNVKRGQDGRV